MAAREPRRTPSRAPGISHPQEMARQGLQTRRVLMILLASMLLVIVAFLVVYLLGADTFTAQPK